MGVATLKSQGQADLAKAPSPELHDVLEFVLRREFELSAKGKKYSNKNSLVAMRATQTDDPDLFKEYSIEEMDGLFVKKQFRDNLSLEQKIRVKWDDSLKDASRDLNAKLKQPTEIAHMVANRFGGKEHVNNASATTKHSNTVDLAIENGLTAGLKANNLLPNNKGLAMIVSHYGEEGISGEIEQAQYVKHKIYTINASNEYIKTFEYLHSGYTKGVTLQTANDITQSVIDAITTRQFYSNIKNAQTGIGEVRSKPGFS